MIGSEQKINNLDLMVLIPAKAASTRLSRKNMRELGGKPLIGWAIDAAKDASVSNHIFVSTEDSEIAEYSRSLGVESLVRPNKLAVDPAGVVDVALHAIAECEARGDFFKTLIILLPTCPFRTAYDIQAALQLFKANNGKFLMSVSEYSHTPFSAMDLDDNSILTPFFAAYIGRKSQSMPKAYRANGAIHVLDIPAFQKEKSYYAQPLIGYVMPPERSVDIDTYNDLLYAEFLIKNRVTE